MEIDHELAISVGNALGPDGIMRAFAPDNLRWLCHDCHAAKTKRDRVLVKILTTGLRPPATKPWDLCRWRRQTAGVSPEAQGVLV